MTIVKGQPATEMQAIAATDGGGDGDGHDDDRSSLSAVDGKEDDCHSKPPSLMTDEDWDHVLANEQQQWQQGGTDEGVGADRESSATTTTIVGLPALAGVVHSSPTKGKVVGHCMTPSSPSELLRLTKTHLAAEGSQFDEAREFGRELGDWVRGERKWRAERFST